jgi:hypothetical protein
VVNHWPADKRNHNQQLTNGVSPYAAHRALLVALDEWVSQGITPPESKVPRRADNNAAFAVVRPGTQTGVVPQEALGWPSIPGVTYNGLVTMRYLLDFGPHFARGILSNYPPSIVGRPAYPLFVSKVDEDGNEVAGIRYRLGLAQRGLRRECSTVLVQSRPSQGQPCTLTLEGPSSFMAALS